MKNQRIEPGRTFAQTDCVFEPAFDSPDNVTFFDSGPDYLLHRQNELCSEEVAHLQSECAFWLSLTNENK